MLGLMLAATLTAANAEIVIPKDATPVVRFAAKEAQEILSEALGAEVPVVSAPTDGKSSLVLGMNAWAAAAGLSTNDLSRDEFVSAAKGNRIYLFGRDSATVDPAKVLRYGDWGPVCFERATTFAVYDFLERYAGARFYFPGPLGTCVPRHTGIEVPEGVRRTKPAYMSRLVQMWSGEYFEPTKDRTEKTLDFFRLRFETDRKPCCHGSTGFMLQRRFGETHPEYFALRSSGARALVDDPSKRLGSGEVCWSSAVKDEIVRDIESHCRGEGPEVRGLLSRDGRQLAWNGNFHGGYVDIMPDDCMDGCRCEACQAIYRKGDPDYASERIWSATAEIARRVGPLGVGICQMAYPPYRRVPDLELPPNVEVMVATFGPWGMKKPGLFERDTAPIRDWAKKLGHKVWLWNYANKWGVIAAQTGGIPTPAPHAWAEFYRRLAPFIEGAFCESETDRWLFNYLNYYVYSRLCWDLDTDVDAVLAEHYRLMFGAASAEMAEFFDRFEKLWMDGIMGRGLLIETPMGPVAQPPTNEVIWNEIYSERTLVAIDALLCAAASKVPAGSLEARRIALFRREYLEPCVAAGAKYRAEAKETAAAKIELKEPGAKASVKLHSLYLGRRALKANVVGTTVEASRTADALVFRFICEEPETGDLASSVRPRDDKDIWKDDVVEICLETVRDGTYYHLFLNSKGSYADCHESHKNMPVKGYEWNLEGVKTSVEVGSGSWTGTFEMPLASLKGLGDEFRINFARERHLKHTSQYDMEYLYQWAPHAIGFGDTDNMGRIILK